MMTVQNVQSFCCGQWIDPGSSARPIADAATGEIFVRAGGGAISPADLLDYAKSRGGPALRAMTFHDRARMVKALAVYLNERKEELYELSYRTGATRKDHAFDIDGGIGTMFVFASKGRREMPDSRVYLDGDVEQLSRGGSFLGQHICTPLLGVAVHINAFNFPVWGLLEKLAPALIAGVPVIVKPATATCYVTELCVRLMLQSGHLPDGAVQLVCGSLGTMLDQLTAQDAVSFTGSAQTALLLKSNPNLIANAVRFIAEQDSLNASILGPDAAPETAEFDLFIKEVHREMTTKAGQKCTAIRRMIVPDRLLEEVTTALKVRLEATVIGNPRVETTRMGALVSLDQRQDVLNKAAVIAKEAECVSGDPDAFELAGADAQVGAFLPPLLYRTSDATTAHTLHETEAFGPVACLMGYRDVAQASELANRGGGSLVVSLITNTADVAAEVVTATAAHHGRIYINNRTSAAESTGHGAPLPHMIHGGPGRAGGGEEQGGVRGVLHYMQRTAIQSSPDMLTALGGRWVPGSAERVPPEHPFRRRFEELQMGETLATPSRTVTLEDIEHFAEFTGDTFYAHMDEAAAQRNPFFPGRVAHGYLLLSFAAGLFVEPAEGPVLANTGLDGLSFLKPVSPGDVISVKLTVKQKTKRTEDYGEVRWHVTLLNQDNEIVAAYELRTMVAM